MNALLPSPLEIVLFLSVAGAILAAFTGLLIRGQLTLPVEQGLTARDTTTCGGRTRNLAIHVTWPFARMSLYDEFLVVTIIPKQVVRYESIRSISKKTPFVFSRIVIEYEKKAREKWIMGIWTFDDSDLNRIETAVMEYKNRNQPVRN